MPDEYVLIEKTGGGKEDYIRNATIAIKSCASTRQKAAELNENVIECMDAIVENDSICKCSLNADYNYPDTGRKKQRYQAVFDIVYY
ncbi:hypothetical protein [Frisingicoccus sp.]|uniref:hypothetical protein n=1 Tax=Frisingicoccus sp. TaxID=1918627 RepID=UPI0025B9171D|nr:hypothetical protein [Frisingicoccus sp.]